jgi:hypothetical protein
MRQMAIRHGLQGVAPPGPGNRTMQELMNTPEARAWQQMQLRDQLPPDKPTTGSFTPGFAPYGFEEPPVSTTVP